MTQTALENTGLALQAPNGHDSLAHLQQVSRIAASTWRRWCELLKLSPSKATEVWEEICAPLEQVSAQRPNISYFLQLRAARSIFRVLKKKWPRSAICWVFSGR